MENLTNNVPKPRVPRPSPTVLRRLVVGAFLIIGILAVMSFIGRFAYIFASVEEQEVGIQFRNNRIHNVVGPGVYSDIGLFVSIDTISTQAITFEVRDEEIITKDKQRIGLIVSGDIFRPNRGQQDLIIDNWSSYRGIYLQDELARDRVIDLARQSMKVCIGDRTFDDNIIGASRDALRQCIDDEVNVLAGDLGLRIENLVVPEVILSGEVQTALDRIVQSRLETEKAAQDQLKAKAEAGAEQARQEGEIRVAQSRIQEEARQQTLLAVLEKERLAAQLAIIEAERANDLAKLETAKSVLESTKRNQLIESEANLDIAKVDADVALERATAATAADLALANIFNQNPEYLSLMITRANASALNATDKVIFTPEGTVPNLVIPGPGITPTVDTAP